MGATERDEEARTRWRGRLRHLDPSKLVFVDECGTTKVVSEADVERVLAPSLSTGQVVVLDNLSAHKGERVRQLVEHRGAELLFLPSYSPDFSPIEEALGKVKALLWSKKARTKGALVEAIGWVLDAVTSEDARGWFGHCGYALWGQLPR